MRFLTSLFLWGAVFAAGISASTKPPLYDLVLPEGFRVHDSKDGWGYALISRKTQRRWVNDAGVIIQFVVDNSHPITNEKVFVQAQRFVDNALEQLTGDYTITTPMRYTVSGKHWVCVPTKAKDPAKKPDMVILVTEFDRMIGVIQIGGKREAWEETKSVTDLVVRLNSPPLAAATPAKDSAR